MQSKHVSVWDVPVPWDPWIDSGRSSADEGGGLPTPGPPPLTPASGRPTEGDNNMLYNYGSLHAVADPGGGHPPPPRFFVC